LQEADVKLLISDHADWNDLLTLIERVKPKAIYTLHGDGTHLSNYFSEKDIEVHMLHNS
jgi:putative mRNA 3-end processing factor